MRGPRRRRRRCLSSLLFIPCLKFPLTIRIYESEGWSSQLLFQLKQLERRSLKKNQDFNGIRTRDLRGTGAMLYQLSYKATHWERGLFVEFISSREEWNDVKYIWNNSYWYDQYEETSLPMCGFIAQLVEHRTGTAEVTGSNPVEALIIFFRLLLSNCLSWKSKCDDQPSLSSTTAVQIWIISYILHINTNLR